MIAGPRGKCICSFVRYCKTPLQNSIPTATCENVYLTIALPTGNVVILKFLPIECVVLTCSSLWVNWNFYLYVWGCFYTFYGKLLIHVFCPFFCWVLVFVPQFKVHYILGILILCFWYMLHVFISNLSGFFLTFLVLVFFHAIKKFCMWKNLSIFYYLCILSHN